ncbi:phage holin family protein [Candidatus Microgenomates bacterium]|nr:phage holin family protein [Candidatus Microgenomates bacterium]
MKSIFQKVLSYFLALSCLALLLPDGFNIENPPLAFLKAIIVLLLIFPVLSWLLKIIMLPLSFLTLGLINFLQSVILFYILTLLIPEISLASQTYQAFSILGLNIPAIILSRFQSYFVAAFIFTIANKFFSWIVN